VKRDKSVLNGVCYYATYDAEFNRIISLTLTFNVKSMLTVQLYKIFSDLVLFIVLGVSSDLP